MTLTIALGSSGACKRARPTLPPMPSAVLIVNLGARLSIVQLGPVRVEGTIEEWRDVTRLRVVGELCE